MVKPILDRVVIRRITEEDKGIVQIADAYKEQSRKGEVVAIGQYVVLGHKAYPITDFVNVGDIVYFGEYNAEPVEINGDKLLVVRIQDIRFAE